MPNLLIVTGDQHGTVHRLTGGRVTVGRGPANFLVLSDHRVSRNHAVIFREGEGFVIEDVGSVNGVYVNNALVQKQILREGDEIKLGATMLRFTQLDGEGEEKKNSSLVHIIPDELNPAGVTIEMRIPASDTRNLIPERVPLDPATLQKVYQRLLILYRVSHEVGTVVDLPNLLERILTLALGEMRADRGFVLLIDPANGAWLPPVVRQREGVEQKEIAISKTIIQTVIQSGEGLLTTDAQQDQRFQEAQSVVFHGIRSAICVPLKTKEKILGVLHVDTHGHEIRFTKDDLELLTAMASPVAVAIENARLFTDLKEANREIKERQAQLIEAEKLSAMGRLAGGVAHEINNPMTCVLGYTTMVRKHLEKGNGTLAEEQFRECLESLKIVEEEAHHCARIAQSLLQFGRRKREEMTAMDINAVIKNVLLVAKFHIKKVAIEIREEFDPQLPSIQANAGQLQQVFLNLIVNARDAMEKTGGTLVISTRLVDNQWVEIRFADTGCGIPADKLEEIFKPLYTTKEEGKGTGLGLSVTQEIVDLHQGTIDVESTVGKGTTFIIRLPAGDSVAR